MHPLGVGDEPVDRGEVLALRQLLVQAPEHLQEGSGAGQGGWEGQVQAAVSNQHSERESSSGKQELTQQPAAGDSR